MLRSAALIACCMAASVAWAADKPAPKPPSPPSPPAPPPVAAPQAFVPIVMDQATLSELLRWADEEFPAASTRKLVSWFTTKELELKQHQNGAK